MDLAVVVAVEAKVVAGELLPLFRLRDGFRVVKLSSISVLSFVSGADSMEELSCASSDLVSMLPSWLRANAEIIFAACRVERRAALGECALKILVVSCETFEVRMLMVYTGSTSWVSQWSYSTMLGNSR